MNNVRTVKNFESSGDRQKALCIMSWQLVFGPGEMLWFEQEIYFVDSCVEMLVNTWWYYFGRICELYEVGEVGESRTKSEHMLLKFTPGPQSPHTLLCLL